MAVNFNKPANAEDGLLALNQIRENIEATLKNMEGVSPSGDIPDKAKRWNPSGYFETYDLAQTSWNPLLFATVRLDNAGLQFLDSNDKGFRIKTDNDGYPVFSFSDFFFFEGAGSGKFPVTMTEAGNTGFNKTDPGYTVDVNGDINFSGDLLVNGVRYDIALGGSASVEYVDSQDALKQDLSEKGQANGYASLDGNGLVPSGQLPSFVDDVLEFANLGSFPGTGETGKIYIAQDTGYQYRWTGSQYADISGKVDSVDGNTGAVDLSGIYLGLNDQAADSALIGGIAVSNLLKLSYAEQTIDGGQSTKLILMCNDDGESVLELMGDAQGTGRLYVGQSVTHGGGIEYNGDNSPGTTGAGADYVTLFRRSAGETHWTARNSHGNNDWEFRGSVTASSLKEGGASLSSLYVTREIHESDWNEATTKKMSLYSGSTNGPAGNTVCMGAYFPHGSGDYGFQIAGRIDDAYLRCQENGAWRSWYKLLRNGGSWDSALTWNGAQTTALDLANADIIGVNKLRISDPGEGIEFSSGTAGTIFLHTIDDANDNIIRFKGNYVNDLILRLQNDGAGAFIFEADEIFEGGDSLESKYEMKSLANFDYPFDLRAEINASARGSNYAVSDKWVVVGSNNTDNKVHILNRRTGTWSEVTLTNLTYYPSGVCIDDTRDKAWVMGAGGTSSAISSRYLRKINLLTSSIENTIDLPSINNSGVTEFDEPRGTGRPIVQDDDNVYVSYSYHDEPGHYSSNLFKVHKDTNTGIAVELEDEAQSNAFNGLYGLCFFNGYLYAVLALERVSQTYTHRAQVRKIDPSDLSTVATQTLSVNTNAVFQILSAGDFLYVISGSSGKADANISRIDPGDLSETTYPLPVAQEGIGWETGAFDGRFIWNSINSPATTDILIFDTFNKAFTTYPIEDIYNTSDTVWSGNGQIIKIVGYHSGRIWGSVFKDDATDQCILFSIERGVVNV